MKPLKSTLVVFLCLLLSQVVTGQEKYSRVKIFTDASHHIAQKKFIHGTLQVDHCRFEDDGCIVEIGPVEMQKLKESGYRFQVLIDDVVADFRVNNDISRFFESERMGFVSPCQDVNAIITTPPAFTTGGMGGYYTLEQMRQALGYLYDNYRSIVDTFSIGRSIENRDIWCIKISDNVDTDENEPEALLNGLQHAREAITGTSLIFFMQYIVQNYASNAKIQALVNNREIFIIPCVNPDGYERNRRTDPGGGGMQRKNRRKNTGSDSASAGVDLNRNYSIDWSNCNGDPSCGSSDPFDDTYWGTSAFSEPETRAIRDFTYSRNFKIAIDQHSNGAYYSLPFGRPGNHTMDPLDALVYTYTPALMGLYNCHRAGNSPQSVGYEVGGGYKDWMLIGDIETFPGQPNRKEKVYGLTGEANGNGFWPTAVNIIPLCKELCFQNIQLVLTAGSYADVQDVNDVVLPSLEGDMGFTARRVGLTDAPITVSIVPLENILTVGAPVVINSMTDYHDLYTGSIPYTLRQVGTGQRIKFIWRVQTGGITIDDTITKFYNPVTVLYDNMETGSAGTLWNITGSWAYTNGGYGGSARAITESPAGNYPAGVTGTNSTITWASNIDLSNATAAYLSFWVRHRTENCRDNLRIQISVNGGSSYSNVCGKNTIAEDFASLGGEPGLTGIRENWTRELVDLRDFIGAGHTNVRLRFQFNSNPHIAGDDYYAQEDQGFMLDNIRLMKSTSTLVILPVKFLRFEGKLMANGTAELSWDAETDAMHDYFEIERSGDRNNFISLGRTVNAPPYTFTDHSLMAGNNYYRVKQVDRDGKVTYSNIINIYYKPGQVNIAVFPNPVNDHLKIRISSVSPEHYSITVNDMIGRMVHQDRVLVGNTMKEVDINFKRKPSQVYILTVRNSIGEVVTTEKIIKQ